MKVLHVNSEMGWRGGEQQLAYQLLNTPSESGIEYHLMCRPQSALESWGREQKVSVVTAPISGSLDIRTVLLIRRYCREHKIGIIHAQTSHAHTLAHYAKLLGLPARLVVHRRISKRVKSGYLAKWKYASKHIDQIICISQNIKNLVEERLGPDKRVSLIYDAVDPERFISTEYKESFSERYSLQQAQYNIINTSALDAGKDLVTFIHAAKIIIDHGIDANFLIAGKGRELANLEALCEQLGLEKRVHFLGFVTDIKDLYNHTDLFLFTSINEGLGSSILEAFVNKVPVVSTNAGGIPELVLDGQTGFLREMSDSDGLAKAVIALLEDLPLQEKFITNGHRLYSERHHVSIMTQNILSIYQKLSLSSH